MFPSEELSVKQIELKKFGRILLKIQFLYNEKLNLSEDHFQIKQANIHTSERERKFFY